MSHAGKAASAKVSSHQKYHDIKASPAKTSNNCESLRILHPSTQIPTSMFCFSFLTLCCSCCSVGCWADSKPPKTLFAIRLVLPQTPVNKQGLLIRHFRHPSLLSLARGWAGLELSHNFQLALSTLTSTLTEVVIHSLGSKRIPETCNGRFT